MGTRFLCYGDFHMRDLGSFQPYTKASSTNGLTVELNNMIRGAEFVAKKITEEAPDVVIDLGDFFHDKSSLSTSTLYGASLCSEIITDSCRAHDAQQIMLVGNHNYFDEGLGINNCNIFSGSFDVIKKPLTVNFGTITVGFIPYSSDVELVQQTLKQYSLECDLIFTHLDFQGCSYDTGVISRAEYNPYLGVPCVSGHIHVNQTIGDVYYPGSVVQHTFSREDLDRVGGVFVFEDNGVSSGNFYKNDMSMHYLKVTDITYVRKNVNRLVNKCVLKVVTTKDEYDKNVDLLNRFDHVFVPVKEKILTKTEIIHKDKDIGEGTMHGLLRDYVLGKSPEYVDLLDEVASENRQYL